MTKPGGAVTIVEATTAADRGRFIDLIYTLYKDDPYWVPPLRGEARELIDGIKTNPWFGHGYAKFWMAMQDGKVVGRISAQVDSLVLEHMGKGIGHWGMFECIDDQSIADLLLDTAENWLRGEGMTSAMGPFSISIWDEPGLLVDGFDRPPTVMMGHHL
ncbi:MAG: dATP pyrophosphohydrolase, partial [Janthinobacterium lividum]